jgi:integrase
MMNSVKSEAKLIISPDIYELQVLALQAELEKREAEIQSLQVKIDLQAEKPPGKEEDRKTEVKTRKRRIVTPYTNTYSDFKSDGKRKPHPADSIRSYSDFKAIQDYFLGKDDVRDWMMWTIGVSMGLRISDLLSLRFGHFIDNDKVTIKPRLEIYEQKTGKLNNLLITESVKLAIQTYILSIKSEFDLDGFLFASKKTGQKMYEEHGWRILSSAGKALGLPINIGSHTMRKSFANIAACVDKSCIDMNAVAKIQGLLNHSDQRVTMKYLGTYQDMFDRARVAVSDFVLGKTGVDEIIAGNQYTVDDIMRQLCALEHTLSSKKEPKQ